MSPTQQRPQSTEESRCFRCRSATRGPTRINLSGRLPYLLINGQSTERTLPTQEFLELGFWTDNGLTGSCSGPEVGFWEVAGIDSDKRACVPLAGQLMALSKPTIAGHQRPLPPQSNSLTAFHRTVVSRRVPVAGAKGPFETTGHAVWSTTFIRSSFIRPPCTSILERPVSISRRSAGVS